MTFYEKWRDVSAENESLNLQIRDWQAQAQSLGAENERLKAEVEAISVGYTEMAGRIKGATNELRSSIKQFKEKQDYFPLHVVASAAVALDILDPQPPQAAIWVRVSQKQSREDAQLQQALLHELATSHKLPIHTVYYLDGVSGVDQSIDPVYQKTFEEVSQQLQSVLGMTVEVIYQSLSQHPETIRMLADVKSGRTKCVIAASPSRLARDKKLLGFLVQTLAAYDCRLITLDGYDTGTPEGKRQLFELISQEEQV